MDVRKNSSDVVIKALELFNKLLEVPLIKPIMTLVSPYCFGTLLFDPLQRLNMFFEKGTTFKFFIRIAIGYGLLGCSFLYSFSNIDYIISVLEKLQIEKELGGYFYSYLLTSSLMVYFPGCIALWLILVLIAKGYEILKEKELRIPLFKDSGE